MILFISSIVLGSLINKSYDDFENLSIIIKLIPYYLGFILIGLNIKLINLFYVDEIYNRLIIIFYKQSYNNLKLVEKSFFDFIWLISII